MLAPSLDEGRIDYDAISTQYDGFRGISAELVDVIVTEARLSQGARILDVGCGTGTIDVMLEKRLNAAIIGVDRSLGMLTAARAKLSEGRWIHADSAALPLRSDTFDCVLMLYVLHHMADFSVAIREAHRLLRSGALVILTASHEQIESSFASRFFPSYAALDKARFPKVGAIAAAMKEAGFTDVARRSVTVAKVTFDEHYLEKVRNKHVSTYLLISEDEFRHGFERMCSYVAEHAGEPPLNHEGTLIVGRKKEFH
ncbi:MAG: methyltransferase domain-containing protein [Candidatus Abyssobacteria bacterium SURF_17]|uniref:Methyltransferase domain-containing protein n=1 Tax=Candidatus Abyssobacteria bacterium SURF_17 TaxID=2093361 RepID=A0A419ESB4_9BACT|nr:MAG: methyltransferase domain-containing protein [Candidatus Abyssubacteria bacterium SURF_17]